MAYILVQQSVEDYDKWKPLFDEHGPIRQANGSKGGIVLRNADDPNHITILLEWDSRVGGGARIGDGGPAMAESTWSVGVAQLQGGGKHDLSHIFNETD